MLDQATFAFQLGDGLGDSGGAHSAGRTERAHGERFEGLRECALDALCGRCGLSSVELLWVFDDPQSDGATVGGAELEGERLY